MQKPCYICKERFIQKLGKDTNHCKVTGHFCCTGKYRGAAHSIAHSICNLRFNVPNEIPVIFHNSSNYDYRFIIKRISKQILTKNLNVLGKILNSTKLFFVLIEKEIKKMIKMVTKILEL